MIRAEALSKRYTIYNRSIDRLHDWCLPRRFARGRPFWALRDINLEVQPGSSLGIVGVNGAGKTTLLKLLTGTTIPTSGSFSVQGRVSALLELGMGFHQEFTGRENIFFNGRLSGLGEAELAAKTPEIIEFSELEDFIDQPLRTYSSGMAMRLAFAVAASVEPQVLIVDEALSVGDIHFQQKCLARIRRFHESGVTVLFVSHDPALIKSFCTEAILLDGGRLIDRGRPDTVLDYYNALLAEKYRDQGSRAQILRPSRTAGSAGSVQTSQPGAGEGDATNELQPAPRTAGETESGGGAGSFQAEAGHRSGNFGAAITQVVVRSTGAGSNSSLLRPGMTAEIVVRAVALERVEHPTVGIQIKDRLGNEVYGINTHLRGIELGSLEPGQAVEVSFRGPINLGVGLYSVTAAIHRGDSHTEICYDWIERAATFQILPTPSERFTGVCRLELEIQHRPVESSEEELALAKTLRGD